MYEGIGTYTRATSTGRPTQYIEVTVLPTYCTVQVPTSTCTSTYVLRVECVFFFFSFDTDKTARKTKTMCENLFASGGGMMASRATAMPLAQSFNTTAGQSEPISHTT